MRIVVEGKLVIEGVYRFYETPCNVDFLTFHGCVLKRPV